MPQIEWGLACKDRIARAFMHIDSQVAEEAGHASTKWSHV